MEEQLVSVIIPVFNAEKFICDTINTVKRQTYKNWECILVDDCSTDKSLNIIKNLSKNDKRIKIISLSKNSGAAMTRNKGIDIAKGKYVAFLDADDMWNSNKLKKQVTFMKDNDCGFSFTGYEFANSSGIPTGKKVEVPHIITYKQALKNTTIFTTTVMIDIEKISKKNIHMPNVKSEDTATWWKILKTGVIAYGINEQLSLYRRSKNTLSSDKIEAIRRIWNLYRNVEKFNIIYSLYNFFFYLINAIRRRI